MNWFSGLSRTAVVLNRRVNFRADALGHTVEAEVH